MHRGQPAQHVRVVRSQWDAVVIAGIGGDQSVLEDAIAVLGHWRFARRVEAEIVHNREPRRGLNLEDGRRITLNTQVEDSEILLVTRDDRALYRVNDAIYEASIQGSSLGPPSLIVRDTNVPEIHWAFLSAGSGGLPSDSGRSAAANGRSLCFRACSLASRGRACVRCQNCRMRRCRSHLAGDRKTG